MLYERDGVSVSSNDTIAPGGGRVLTLTMSMGKNEINDRSVALLEGALQAIDQDCNLNNHRVLVIASGDGKFFCNGLDVEWMMSVGAHATGRMLERFWRWLGRLLVLNCTTVCAINGHCFGAGLFIALACDRRLMRTERGFVCFPEAALGMRISKAFAELAKAKLGPEALRSGFLEGRRFGSRAGCDVGIIDEEVPVDRLLERAHEVAASKLPSALRLTGFSPDNFSKMKMELYTDAFRALTYGKAATEPHARL